MRWIKKLGRLMRRAPVRGWACARECFFFFRRSLSKSRRTARPCEYQGSVTTNGTLIREILFPQVPQFSCLPRFSGLPVPSGSGVFLFPQALGFSCSLRLSDFPVPSGSRIFLFPQVRGVSCSLRFLAFPVPLGSRVFLFP